jgi:sugar-phosphatase
MTEPPLRCGALLFDLDGVLVNSAELVERTWRRWAAQHQLDPERVIAMAHGRRTIETVRLVAPHLAATDEVAALEMSEASTTEGVYEVPGARELLEPLPLEVWAIVTSGIRTVATLRIRHTRLPMPRVLVCADEIQHGKPHPEGYLTAAMRLGRAATDCVVIEDTPAGLEAARAAGMRAIGVCGTYAANALAMADLIVTRLDQLRISGNADGEQLDITTASR